MSNEGTRMPGDLLRKLLSRVLSREVLETLVIPTIADLQHETAQVRQAPVWRRAFVFARGHLGVWKTLALHLATWPARYLRRDWRGAEAAEFSSMKEDRMGSRMKVLVGTTIGLALGVALGFSVGQRQGFKMGMGFLETQVKGTLSINVEAASCIRVGDTTRALKLLDKMIDSAVTSVVAQPGPLHAPEALSQAKLYRSIIPPAGPAASVVQTALEKVPMMQAGQSPSRSGLTRLAREAGA